MSFKLLAIRPMKGCNPKFLKNLEEGRIYKFYNDYKFYNGKERIDDFDYEIDINSIRDVERIEIDETLPKDFFGKNINISAIVGKNGSGKSALIELLIVCINQLSLKLKGKKLLSDAELISATEEEGSKIKCELFYKINTNDFFKLIINDVNFLFVNLNNEEVSFSLEEFFYTEVINYSIYSFNSNIIGKWIDGLFHKNDSYQIPVVINPKREGKDNIYWAGTIDVNNEHYLLKQRLLNNILQPIKDNDLDFRRVGDNMIAVKVELNKKEIRDFFIYSNDESQIGRKITEYEDKKALYENFKDNPDFDFSVNIDVYNQDLPLLSCHNIFEILNKIKSEFDLKDIPDNDLQMQLDYYIIYKIISICDKYVEYRQFVNKSSKTFSGKEYARYTINILEFINHLKKYKSHITYKLFQAINYIKYFDDVWGDIQFNNKLDLNLISNKLIKPSIDSGSLIEVLFPPIFETEIYLENGNDESLIKLSELSSGEQQFIHSVSSIIYHLNNLNSVKGETIIKYKYINLVFDEIELYFHPEFQRRFVNYILKQINNANLRDILGINILFVTHSPFILSDIPKQNVLFLEVGENKKSSSKKYLGDNTFAENIHEMLTDGFFIDSTKGEFAISKINEFLNFYKKAISIDQQSEYFEAYKQEYNSNNFSLLVSLIGEEYIRRILENHIDVLEKLFGTKSYKEKRILELKAEIAKLEK